MEFALQPVIAVHITRREQELHIQLTSTIVRNPVTGVHLLPRDQIGRAAQLNFDLGARIRTRIRAAVAHISGCLRAVGSSPDGGSSLYAEFGPSVSRQLDKVMLLGALRAFSANTGC